MENFPMKIKNILIGILNYTFNKNNSISELRFQQCNKCKYLVNEKNKKICGLCGCFLDLKTTVQSEKCPIGKW